MRHLKHELWPHYVLVDDTESSMKVYEIESWLGETMGPFKEKWNAVYHYDSTMFYFKQGRDATLFSLRWL